MLKVDDTIAFPGENCKCSNSLYAGNSDNKKIPRIYNSKDFYMVGMPGIEPGTSSLSVTRSSQLSYMPIGHKIREKSIAEN